MRIAIIIPSRGLIFSKTIAAVLAEVDNYDVHFFLQARERGEVIGVSDLTCGQYKLLERGIGGTNDGWHKIDEWLLS